jgi:hypothetical protein
MVNITIVLLCGLLSTRFRIQSESGREGDVYNKPCTSVNEHGKACRRTDLHEWHKAETPTNDPAYRGTSVVLWRDKPNA